MRSLPLTLAAVATSALILQSGVASAAQLPDVSTVGPPEAAEAVTTDLPDAGSQPASVSSAAGTLAMEVPATGSDLTRDGDAVAVFDGTASDTLVSVEGGTAVAGCILANVV